MSIKIYINIDYFFDLMYGAPHTLIYRRIIMNERIIVSNMTLDQKEWLRKAAVRQGISMATVIKTWINVRILEDELKTFNK